MMTVQDRPQLHYGYMYDEDKYARLRLQKCASLLSDWIIPGSRILEIGCYTAEMLNFLPKQTAYFGVDFDEAALEIARGRGAIVKHVNFDSAQIEFDQPFDIVIATEVLEHLKNPEAMISQIKRLLKPGGVVLISLPNENTLYHRLLSLLGFGIDMCAFQLYKHLHLPTIKQSKAFVGRHFRIVKESFYTNPSCKGSRFEWLGRVLTLFPDASWEGLARLAPSLFARGVIFVGVKEN